MIKKEKTLLFNNIYIEVEIGISYAEYMNNKYEIGPRPSIAIHKTKRHVVLMEREEVEGGPLNVKIRV